MDTLEEFRATCKTVFEKAETAYVESKKRARTVLDKPEAEGDESPAPKRDFIAAQVQQLYYRMKNKK